MARLAPASRIPAIRIRSVGRALAAGRDVRHPPGRPTSWSARTKPPKLRRLRGSSGGFRMRNPYLKCPLPSSPHPSGKLQLPAGSPGSRRRRVENPPRWRTGPRTNPVSDQGSDRELDQVAVVADCARLLERQRADCGHLPADADLPHPPSQPFGRTSFGSLREEQVRAADSKSFSAGDRRRAGHAHWGHRSAMQRMVAAVRVSNERIRRTDGWLGAKRPGGWRIHVSIRNSRWWLLGIRLAQRATHSGLTPPPMSRRGTTPNTLLDAARERA